MPPTFSNRQLTLSVLNVAIKQQVERMLQADLEMQTTGLRCVSAMSKTSLCSQVYQPTYHQVMFNSRLFHSFIDVVVVFHLRVWVMVKDLSTNSPNKLGCKIAKRVLISRMWKLGALWFIKLFT